MRRAAPRTIRGKIALQLFWVQQKRLLQASVVPVEDLAFRTAGCGVGG